MLILEKMLVLMILVLVGLLLVKVRILDERTSQKLSAIVLNVANPALIIVSSQTEHTIPDSQLLLAVGIAVILYALLILIAFLLPKLMKLQQDQANAYAMMTIFSNIGFMGIPLVSELFGDSAMLYVSIFILLYNLLMYTYGVVLLQRGANPDMKQKFSIKKFANPGVISSIVAVAFYLLRVRLPDVLISPMEYLGNLNAPLGMIVIGVTLANVKFRSFFTDGKLLAFSAIKLLLIPILSCWILKQFIGSGDLLGVCVVMMSVPVGSMTVMMAQQYGGEYTLLSKGVTLTTLLCIATIPAVFAILL